MTFSDIIVLVEPNKKVTMNNYKSWFATPVRNKLYLQILTKECMKVENVLEEKENDIMILKIIISEEHFYVIAVYLHPLA